MTPELRAAYDAYDAARKRLVSLSPCPECCPPQFPCDPGYYILGCDMLRCETCGGDGFLITWEDE